MATLILLAIPSSSGQSFQRCLATISLQEQSPSQSLLHQVNRSNEIERGKILISMELAIPSSSGQSFQQLTTAGITSAGVTRNPFFIRSIVPTIDNVVFGRFFKRSQSLLHQVNRSNSELEKVRVSKSCLAIPSSSGQSFQHQQNQLQRGKHYRLAIPSSSGQSFQRLSS